LKSIKIFENDIYNALKEGLTQDIEIWEIDFGYIPKRQFTHTPEEFCTAFVKFCAKHKLDFEILDEIFDDIILKKGDLLSPLKKPTW